MSCFFLNSEFLEFFYWSWMKCGVYNVSSTISFSTSLDDNVNKIVYLLYMGYHA